ncbi:MBL fold metallo-hydrolase [Archangium sp.]|uniref:MBL fold metallo-hydrolase n=1 Tax=Archangium sp. TaxID=1872627 RepID=UPI00389AA5A6
MHSDTPVFLKPHARIEPLILRWLADHHLIPPVHRALKVMRSHLPVLQSFLDQPKRHAEAVRIPALRGGSFVDLPVERAPEVRELIDRTLASPFGPKQLAEAIQALDDRLVSDPGTGIERVYPEVPESLRGLVELYYDTRHRARFRLIEPLLYRSGLYREEEQSLQLSLAQSDERAFGYSTPRLDGPGLLTLDLPFSSPLVEFLTSLRFRPRPLGEVREALRLEGERAGLLETFLTPEGVPASPRYQGPGVRLRYFGHASLLLETKDVAIMVDPTLGYGVSQGEPRSSFAQLPERLDCVFITHAHADHFSVETLLQLRGRTDTVVVPRSSRGNLSDPSLDAMLRAIGFRHVRALDDLETLEFPGGRATAIPFLGEHGDLDILSKASWLLELGGQRVFIGSDASVPEPRLYERLAPLLRDVDAFFYAVEANGAPLSWGNGPLLTQAPNRQMDQTRRQGSATGTQLSGLLELLRPRHYYSYALGLEPWLRHVVATPEHEVKTRLREVEVALETCRRLGIPGERLYGQAELMLGLA